MADDKFRLGILTISDTGSKGERKDTSGDAISEIMALEGFVEVAREIVPDEQDIISAKLKDWCDGGTMDVVLTTGGTGLGPRDVTPEATRVVLDIEVPGIAEAMRIQTLKHTPLAMLSRSMSGVRSGCLIVNLPGSEKAVRETLAVAVKAIPHGLQMLKGWRMH
jgi:molybdopterin adenylyltransferase